MSTNPIELYNEGGHQCLIFHNLVTGSGIQANQFLIMDGKDVAVLDPGGDLTYTPLSIELSKRSVVMKDVTYALASHQDPDIISSMPRWLMHTDSKVVISKLWSRFLPHLASNFVTDKMSSGMLDRIIEVPDEGMCLPFGENHIKALPAHFLHSVGNIQFYDPVSKILFSGDLGASVGNDSIGPVTDFDAHIPKMLGFHQRYICANRVCRLWADMVHQLDIEKIVPQHGAYFEGPAMVGRFIDWIADLQCGVDLLTGENFRVPK